MAEGEYRGSINPSDVATLSLLGGRGGYGYGGSGYGGGGYNIGNQVLAANAHADGTAIGSKLDASAIRHSDQITSISAQFENAARQEQINSVNNNVSELGFRNGISFSALTKDITDAEFRGLDRQRDIERMLVQNAKDAAECCCDTQKLILSEGNETRALVLAVEGRASTAALHVAQARINQLETINALNSGHGHR